MLLALPPLAAAAGLAWWRGFNRIVSLLLVAAFVCAGPVLGAHAREAALHTPLRTLLDSEFGGFALESFEAAGAHPPVETRLLLLEDAGVSVSVVSLRAEVRAVRLRGGWKTTFGGVIVA